MFEKNPKSIYDIDQLTAIEWMKQVWSELREEIVFNCCCNTGLILSSESILKNS